MTSYTKQYVGTKQQKEEAALGDAVEYAGERGMRVLREYMQSMVDDPNVLKYSVRKHIRFQLFFGIEMLGIRGLPARALVRQLIREVKS